MTSPNNGIVTILLTPFAEHKILLEEGPHGDRPPMAFWEPEGFRTIVPPPRGESIILAWAGKSVSAGLDRVERYRAGHPCIGTLDEGDDPLFIARNVAMLAQNAGIGTAVFIDANERTVKQS